MKIEIPEKAKEILCKLEDNDFPSYIVGGYVRDALLGNKSSDIDIATKARPKDVIRIFKSKKLTEVGKHFGVIRVDDYDIATFRKDRYMNLDGSIRKVVVEYSDSLKDDVSRRDLTINSIALTKDSEIIDFNGGVKDLEDRLIKFVGEPKERIFEDALRILRAIRFATLLDGYLDNESYEIIRSNSDLIEKIPKERIQQEIKKVLKIKKASKFFILLYQTNSLKSVLSILNNTIGLTQNKLHSESLFTHNMLTGDAISCKYPMLKLAGYLHDIGKVTTKIYNYNKSDYVFYDHEIKGSNEVIYAMKNLCFSLKEIDYVSGLIKMHMRATGTEKSARKTMRSLHELDIKYTDFIRLKIADRKGNLGRDNFKISEIKDMLNKIKDTEVGGHAYDLKKLVFSGKDIMKIRDIPQGKVVGDILNYLLDEVIDEPISNNFVTLTRLIKNYKIKED